MDIYSQGCLVRTVLALGALLVIAAPGTGAVGKPEPNPQFSNTLGAFLPMLPSGPVSPQGQSDSLIRAEKVSPAIRAKRIEIIACFDAVGIDLATNPGSMYASGIGTAAPRTWSRRTPAPLSGAFAMPFSVDAPFYHRIPTIWPKVELPSQYVASFQLNTVHGWDGCGTGVVISSAKDPIRTVFGNIAGSARSVPFRISDLCLDQLPDNPHADQHVYVIDSTNRTGLDLWHPRRNADGRDYDTPFTPGPFELPSLGDHGGATAAGIPTLGMLVRPGEEADPVRPIAHALVGCADRMWRARVYPAMTGDAAMWGDDRGFRKDGLVPYGGLVQLDPTLDLTTLHLSLPAFRILQAIQTYGWYLVDCGSPDLDIFTATDASAYARYGGVYQGPQGDGVQNQVLNVLHRSRLFLVAPIVRSAGIAAWVQAHDNAAIARRRRAARIAEERTTASAAVQAAAAAQTRVKHASAAVCSRYDGRLLLELCRAVASGHGPTYHSDAMGGEVRIDAANEQGHMRLSIAGATVDWSWQALNRVDRCHISVALARDPDSRAIAGFYLLDLGRTTAGMEQLALAGSQAAPVLAIFR